MLCTLSSGTHGLAWHWGKFAQHCASNCFGSTPTSALPRFCRSLLGIFSTLQALYDVCPLQCLWLGLEPNAHDLRLKVTQHVA